MKNPRLKGVVEKFCESYNIDGNEGLKYQNFVNYLLLNKTYYDINQTYPFNSSFDMNLLNAIDFDTNEENGMAVDGFFAIHNGQILHLDIEDEELDAAMDCMTKDYLHIFLIQTKSGNMATEDMSSLSDCLATNFKGQVKWAKFQNFRQKCENLLQSKPAVKISFTVVYVSGNIIDSNMFKVETFKVRENALIKAMSEFFWIDNIGDCKIEYLDESKIYAEYENLLNHSKTISQILVFENITNEITCANAIKIRFGAITVEELMKILYDNSNDRANELYEYNVRDAINNSPINDKIKCSLQNEKDAFLLLNNGITIIVDKQERKGDKGVYLENIRIVNGCQTCHSIMNVYNNNNDCRDALVAVKIIETNDETILGKITYSSNNQNHVSKSNLFAIEPKVFELEKEYTDFFIAHKVISNKLSLVLLERRQGQYFGSGNIYIDMLAQAKAYISLWEYTPNTAIMYSDQNLNKYKTYLDDANFIKCSLFSGILWNEVLKNIPRSYYNARFQIFTSVSICWLHKGLNINELNISDVNNILREAKKANLTDILNNGDLDIKYEVEQVCRAIDDLPVDFPKLSSGKIHYRKFYPNDAMSKIYSKYINIRENEQ